MSNGARHVFAQIQIVTHEGPGRRVDSEADTSSASGASERDQITGTCLRFALTYDYGHMGATQHLPTFTAGRGLVTSIDSPAATWSPAADDPRGWTFTPIGKRSTSSATATTPS